MSKKRKWSRVGWIGKSVTDGFARLPHWPKGDYDVSVAFVRGKKDDWCDGEWPPRKVRVTVEEI